MRDINDPSTSLLALKIKQKIKGLSSLAEKLTSIHHYLSNISIGKIPLNYNILYNLQNILSNLPNLNIDELIKSMLIKTNDLHLAIYISTLIRSIVALHELLSNKIKFIDIDDVLDRTAGLDQLISNNK